MSFLSVGHVTTDLIGGAELLGGSALYASVQVRALGWRARVLTAAHPDWRGGPLLCAFETRLRASAATTTFHYETVVGRRRARVLAAADPLAPAELPAGWQESEVAFLCPVLGEVDPAFAEVLRPRILGVAPQGWMRAQDGERQVVAARWESEERVLSRASAVFLSEEDSPEADSLALRWAERVPAVVVTRGARGSTVYAGGARVDVPAAPAEEVDPTGAGDVYAAAYLVAQFEGASVAEAASFASAAAACAVEAGGVAGIQERRVIEARALR